MAAPKYILGRKLGMTHIFTEEGLRIPVTVVEAGPCTVAQVKTVENDGYLALQLAFEGCREKVLTKPRMGHLKKAGLEPHRFLREVRLSEPSDLNVGDSFGADAFEVGDRIDVVGTVKGRGFQGTVRAHNFAIKRKTHGGMEIRAPGSIGMHSYPGEVLKGKKMPTHWGDERATVRNLQVVAVEAEKNVLLIKGAVPGNDGSFVIVRTARAYRVRQS